jgi:hypothetical protein
MCTWEELVDNLSHHCVAFGEYFGFEEEDDVNECPLLCEGSGAMLRQRVR